MPKYTEEELALLSDAEREGLEDPNLIDDPIEDSNAPEPSPAAPAPTQAPVVTAEPEKPATEDTAPPPAADAVAPPVAATAEPAPPAPAAPVAPARPVTPPLHRPAPADIDQQITGAKEAQRDLAAKFDAGDISAMEYEQQRQELDDRLFDLRSEKVRGTQSFDSLKHYFLNDAVPVFLSSHQEYAPDSPLYAALDEKVKILQVTTYKDNPFDPQVLEDAHEALNAIRGIGKTPAPKDPNIPAKPDGQRELMPNLGALPAAGEDDLSGDGGRFAHLDRLSGIDYETALAALSPADRERYLQA